MLFALLALALIALVLAAPLIVNAIERRRATRPPRRRGGGLEELSLYDPGRERRAEQRARELLRSCVNEEEWSMYRDLGFIRVAGRHARRESDKQNGPAYAYLVYPHKPIVAFVPASGQLLSEYCVEFPDLTGRRRAPAPARLGRRAREVDGAHLGRGPGHPAREPAPRGTSARPRPRPPRSLAARGVGAAPRQPA